MLSEKPFADPAADERPQLNFDILRLVCNYLVDVSDVFSFALTCSALTEDSFRRRLRMSPVDLSNGNSLDQFHTFIFSNELSRAPCIYGLKLPIPYDDPQVMVKPGFFDHLVAILEVAVHVQSRRATSDFKVQEVVGKPIGSLSFLDALLGDIRQNKTLHFR